MINGPPCGDGGKEWDAGALTARKRRLKLVPRARGYSWATLPPGVINTVDWPSRLGVGEQADKLSP